MTSGHPLLTRAVFVKRLVEIANSAERDKLLEEIQPEENYFLPFIDKILTREINEKWIDKYGEPPQPLLSLEEHHQVLRLLAEEMWISKTGSLSSEMCSSLADLFCEIRGIKPTSARQIRERLSQHALLVSVGSNKNQVAFDHDHFREFFLGEQIGMYLADSAKSDLRKMLRAELLPNWTLDSAVSVALRRGASAKQVATVVMETAESESPASFTRENSGALCIRLLEHAEGVAIDVRQVALPGDALRGRKLTGASFTECYFRPSSLYGSHLERVVFRACDFDRLDVDASFRVEGVQFVDCRIHGLSIERQGSDTEIYDPSRINRYLEMIGCAISGAGLGEASEQTVAEIMDIDPQLQIVRKLLMIFMRSTQVSDHILNLRLGVHAHKFFSEIRSELLDVGVLAEVKHTGAGSIHRYRLGRQVSVIEEALTSCNGSYSEFLKHVRSLPG